jgi:hypothetical protein
LKKPVITLLKAGLFRNNISQIQSAVMPEIQISVQNWSLDLYSREIKLSLVFIFQAFPVH